MAAAAPPPDTQDQTGAQGGLSPEQAQIVDIAVSDPAILAAIAEKLTGGGAAIDPRMAAALSGQGGPQGPQQMLDRRMFG